MAQMRNLLSIVVATVVCVGNGFAQSAIPAADPAQDISDEWSEAALKAYRSLLDRDPRDASLWVRVADIEARLGNLDASLAALRNAAQHAPRDAMLHQRLSQALAVADQPQAALDAIERALTVKPDEPEFLRSRGTLATWVGDYSRAQESYRRLLKLQPGDVEASLNLARVSSWDGKTNGAAEAYRRYLKTNPGEPGVWIELAKNESWRGNYGAALETLSGYRARFGESPEYSRALAAVLAYAGQPGKALETLEPFLQQHPDDYELNLTRAIALTQQRRGRDVSTALDAVRRLQPDSPDTKAAERAARAVLASSVEPGVEVYSDSSSLDVQRVAPKATVQLASGTTLGGGIDRETLRALPGSGLEQIGGNPRARHDQVWVSVAQRFGRIDLRGRAGQARAEGHVLTTYGIGADLTPFDGLKLSVERNSGFFAVSPRTVAFGLRQVGHRAQLDWSTINFQTVADVSYQTLSDGNRRWEFAISPRRSVARRERLNLDLGILISQLGTTKDLEGGYYDPRRYEYYAATVYPYFKIHESVGVGFSLALGAQRDDISNRFRLGGNATAEATFGIYDPWMLKLSGSGIFNQRLGSGAFRGYSSGVSVIRRF
jgi:tetratricopeptide (TPR) repeat protein